MTKFDFEIEDKLRKLTDQMQKMAEQKAKLEREFEANKQKLELARKFGVITLEDYEERPNKYEHLKDKLDKSLTDDYERQFFKLPPLADDDPRRPKRRGRKPKEDSQAPQESNHTEA